MQMIGHHRETRHFDSETTGKQTNAIFDPRFAMLKAIAAQKCSPDAAGHAMHPARTGQVEEITASGGHGGSMRTEMSQSICMSLFSALPLTIRPAPDGCDEVAIGWLRGASWFGAAKPCGESPSAGTGQRSAAGAIGGEAGSSHAGGDAADVTGASDNIPLDNFTSPGAAAARPPGESCGSSIHGPAPLA
ncbi:hypothetical protein LBMAG53_25480 [Planctomycetota bacterium]|nr:hypothetical protein LBMAG53_25480 [Planctomycetota bacterium]